MSTPLSSNRTPPPRPPSLLRLPLSSPKTTNITISSHGSSPPPPQPTTTTRYSTYNTGKILPTTSKKSQTRVFTNEAFASKLYRHMKETESIILEAQRKAYDTYHDDREAKRLVGQMTDVGVGILKSQRKLIKSIFNSSSPPPPRLSYFINDRNALSSKSTSINTVRLKYSRRPGGEGGKGRKNGFFRFLGSYVVKVRSSHGDNYSYRSAQKEAGRIWSEMTLDERRPYVEMVEVGKGDDGGGRKRGREGMNGMGGGGNFSDVSSVDSEDEDEYEGGKKARKK